MDKNQAVRLEKQGEHSCLAPFLLHTVENPDDHLIIEPKTIKEIIALLAKAWDVVTSKKSS